MGRASPDLRDPVACLSLRSRQTRAAGGKVVVVAGRLAAVDDRYSDWAAEVGVPVGSVKTRAEKDDLIAELDALVSLLYTDSARTRSNTSLRPSTVAGTTSLASAPC